MSKQPSYEYRCHTLDTKMLQASSLPTEQEQQAFVTQTFVDIHKLYQEKHISHADYIRLVNRLAAYKQGAFNDYLDTLVGAAQMNMLDTVVEQSKQQDVAAQSRMRRDAVTGLTGVQPIMHDTDRR